MTGGERRGARSCSGFDAQAIAAACVGLALLVGTEFSGLNRSAPAFPTVRAVAPVSERSDADLRSEGAGRQAVTAPPRGQVGAPEESGRIGGSPPRLDINSADATAFQALPGVGPTLAQNIVAYRALHGPFRTPDDLLRVSGIGPKRYARFQGRIRTAEAP